MPEPVATPWDFLSSDAPARVALDALYRGDIAALGRCLDNDPTLLHERIIDPENHGQATKRGYFADPKLFWFVADNPTLVETMPPTICALAQYMIDRGVEQDDLDYTLELTMTSSHLREQDLQIPLMRTLLDAGAFATPRAIDMTGGHCETAALRELLARGLTIDAPVAAALGELDTLQRELVSAPPDVVRRAFALAVINGHVDATTLALDAGADVNAFLVVHEHGTALHAAALSEDPMLLQLLFDRGAQLDTHDKLWNATPLEWAVHENKPIGRAILERAEANSA